ncbi:hypothetical protein MKW98_005486, partial [Papaver atlanticum]
TTDFDVEVKWKRCCRTGEVNPTYNIPHTDTPGVKVLMRNENAGFSDNINEVSIRRYW